MRIHRCDRILFIISTKFFCQESIGLESIPFETQNLPIYIKEVIEERKEKFLGSVENELREDIELKLYSNAIQAFRDASFSYLVDTNPIYIKGKLPWGRPACRRQVKPTGGNKTDLEFELEMRINF